MKTIHNPQYASLIQYLIDTRKRASLTQSQLATRLGKHQSYVAKVEKCERKLDVIEFVYWCHALDRDSSEIIGRITNQISSTPLK